MKARESALRLKRFEADEKARKVADLEHMIREFENMAADLDRQIQAEEDRTGVKDPAHFAYSTFAKSASQRRDNLRASVGGLQAEARSRAARARRGARAGRPRRRASTRTELRSRRRAERASTVALR